MQARTVLTALAALLLVLAVAPYAPLSDPDLDAAVRGDERETVQEARVDREGPAFDRGGRVSDPGDRASDPGDGGSEPAEAAEDSERLRATGGEDRRITGGGNEETSDDDDRDAGPVAAHDHDDRTTQGGPDAVYRYAIESRGVVGTDVDEFARTTGRILTDARGWTLGGSIAFERDGSEPDFTVVLASPEEVAAAHEECGPEYSCRVEDEILVNDRNWREATGAWWRADGELATYRQYLINHEVGHFLGFGHVDCGEAGEPAPVMQQQSVSMQECEPNGWPLDREREQLAQQLGVSEEAPRR